jgi:hypothetical protein
MAVRLSALRAGHPYPQEFLLEAESTYADLSYDVELICPSIDHRGEIRHDRRKRMEVILNKLGNLRIGKIWGKSVSFCSETFVRTFLLGEALSEVASRCERKWDRILTETRLSRQTSVELPKIKYNANPNQQFWRSYMRTGDKEKLAGAPKHKQHRPSRETHNTLPFILIRVPFHRRVQIFAQFHFRPLCCCPQIKLQARLSRRGNLVAKLLRCAAPSVTLIDWCSLPQILWPAGQFPPRAVFTLLFPQPHTFLNTCSNKPAFGTES